MGESSIVRPNIRIEIHNNLMESMDVDEPNPEGNVGEEGEIVDEPADVFDCNITYTSRPTSEEQKKQWGGSKIQGFATEKNIFDKEEYKKRSERAKRFELDPNGFTNFSDENLQSLYVSLGITDDSNKEVRFEAVHMYGTEEMDSIDVMKYFIKYAPESIEWISDNSCNVVWTDTIPSARALFYLSSIVKGMPVEGTSNVNDEDDNMIGKSLLKNSNRQVELDDDDKAMEDEVSLSDIKIAMPAGYWRLGVSHEKSKCILLRFALKSDKNPAKVERFSEYYKKYGNPNYGGLKGLISESKKAEFRGIFERNKEINSKNPWGDLAKTWHKDKKTEEVLEKIPQPNSRLQQRLGFKRSQQVAFELDEKKVEAKSRTSQKTKVPRMRMYADEEEDKIKRKKALEAIKRKANPPKPVENDLRNVIRRKDNVTEEQIENIEDIDQDIKREMTHRLDVDLGNKLMNRRLKFNNTASLPSLTVIRRNNTSDVRERINISKISKQHRFHEEVIKHKPLKTPTPTQRHKNTSNSRYTKLDHGGIEKIDLIDDVYFDEDGSDMKTNSKVTVVIKKPKQPTVASTVWSRVNTNIRNPKVNASIKDRLQLPNRTSRRPISETRREQVSSSSSDESSSDSSESAEEDNNADVKMCDDSDQEHTIKHSIVHRPGFRTDLTGDHKLEDFKSPLRIEINNDLFKK